MTAQVHARLRAPRVARVIAPVRVRVHAQEPVLEAADKTALQLVHQHAKVPVPALVVGVAQVLPVVAVERAVNTPVQDIVRPTARTTATLPA